MTPLIKKEVRLLLPAWIAALLLAIFALPNPIWTHWFTDAPSIGVPLGFVLGFLFLGLQSFGQELSSGTFSALLAQPMERHRIWRIKMGTLALAFVSVLFVWAVPREFHSFTRLEENQYWNFPFDLENHLLLFALAIFSGALWTILLLRHLLGAFWLTLLVPIALDFLIGYVSDRFNWSVGRDASVTRAIFIIYSVAGFFWARRMFLNAQDTQWTGGNFLFPWRKRSVESTSSNLFGPFRNRFFTLIWKEIQLHEANLFLALILLFINVAAVILRLYVSNDAYKTALEFAWALWLLMPLLIGCAAVAEERRLGVMESQLCLPASRRFQFFIKFFFALALSMLLGAVMPTIIERTPNFGITSWIDYWIFFAAPAWFCVSFYASTLSRSTIQAIGLAIAVPTVAATFVAAFCRFAFNLESEHYHDIFEPMGRAVCLIYFGVPTFVLILMLLMFWNFKWLHQNLRLWRNNLAIVLVSFLSIYLFTFAIYYRSWEFFTPVESARGPVRLQLQTPVKFFNTRNRFIAVLPDGKIWAEDIYYRGINAGKSAPDGWYVCSPAPQTQKFIGTSDGTNFAVNYEFIAAINPDGTLWAMQTGDESKKMQQVGSDTNWTKLAGYGRSFLLLKRDGTLWNYLPMLPYPKALKTYGPTRIGTESNWVDIVSYPLRPGLIEKSDGSLWNWQAVKNRKYYFSHIVEQTNTDTQWLNCAFDGYGCFYIQTNGTLWFSFRSPDTGPVQRKAVQLGPDSNWKAVAFSESGSLFLLRTDGTLWKCKPFTRENFDAVAFFKSETFHPYQVGHNSDWIALFSENWPMTALTSDGSLWAWDERSDHFWLAPSRRPVYMGNIFQTTGGNAP